MFGFPRIDRDDDFQYASNFLRSAIFQVRYDSIENIKEIKSEIKGLFIESFPRYNDAIDQGIKITAPPPGSDKTPYMEAIKDKEGMEMRSQDGKMNISIAHNQFTLTVSGDVYSNFLGLLNQLSAIDRFFEICDIKRLSRVSLRKINVIDFLHEGNDMIETSNKIFSSNVTQNIQTYPGEEFIKKNIQQVTYESENDTLIFKHGLVPELAQNQGNGNYSSVLIDIDRINVSDTPVNEMTERAKELNREIFDIFLWSLSQESKELLGSNQ